MASLDLQTSASYTVNEAYQVDTCDHDDHSFSGIMFDIRVKETLPVEYVELGEVYVRGSLGTMSVWMCEDGHGPNFDNQSAWRQLYKGYIAPSLSELAPIQLSHRATLQPGRQYGLYVHSTSPDDRGVVYDNQRHFVSHEDRYIQVFPGLAHISPIPFNSRGSWGWAWRPKREFVGRLSFGVKFLLCKPQKDLFFRFPSSFRIAVLTLMLCSNGPGSKITPDIVLYIINMCPWNWFGELLDEEDTIVHTRSELLQDEARSTNSQGIGWHSENYRQMLAQHARQSSTGRDYVYASEESSEGELNSDEGGD